MHSLIRILLLLLFFASCSPVKNERPQGPPAPAPPAETDYTKPGSYGKVGVETREPGAPTRDVPIPGWMEEGSLKGGSLAEREKGIPSILWKYVFKNLFMFMPIHISKP